MTLHDKILCVKKYIKIEIRITLLIFILKNYYRTIRKFSAFLAYLKK